MTEVGGVGGVGGVGEKHGWPLRYPSNRVNEVGGVGEKHGWPLRYKNSKNSMWMSTRQNDQDIVKNTKETKRLIKTQSLKNDSEICSGL